DLEMSLKNIFREFREKKDGNGNKHGRSRSEITPVGPRFRNGSVQQSRWANLPPELLLDVIKRLEASQTCWPARRHVVACASVCKSWRDITKEVVKTPEECGRLTFPISLKQPGPRDSPIHCFIRRERGTNTYRLSNFLGTKFTVYDNQPPYEVDVPSSSRTHRRIHSKQVSPRVPAGNYNIGTIGYELNVLRARGPRRMQCTMYSIPISSILEGGTAPTPTLFPQSLEEQFCLLPTPISKDQHVDFSSKKLSEPLLPVRGANEPLILKNKAPRWHEQLQCWCLNFRGRVTVASVKNFQLVAAVEPSHNVSQEEQEKVILQFGKIGKDIFTMDYCYPLSAFQAFAICLSSFDTKPACE
ncbi:hypothetical protein IFM89_007225, partial [Coptis chinensis]